MENCLGRYWTFKEKTAGPQRLYFCRAVSRIGTDPCKVAARNSGEQNVSETIALRAWRLTTKSPWKSGRKPVSNLDEGDVLLTFCVFDLLVRDGHSIMDRPLVERKALLAALLDPAPPNVLYARHIDATTADAPVSWLYEHALGLKLEGVVGKLAQSKYRPGVRTTDWFKLKRPGAVPPERFHRKK